MDMDDLKKLLMAAIDVTEEDEIAANIYNNAPREAQAKLAQRIEDKTADTSELCCQLITSSIAGLSKDKWWEPPTLPEKRELKNMGLHMWAKGVNGKSHERYVDLALQLMGDRPAGSITYHNLLEEALASWCMDIRNEVRDWMIENKLIKDTDPLA